MGNHNKWNRDDLLCSKWVNNYEDDLLTLL